MATTPISPILKASFKADSWGTGRNCGYSGNLTWTALWSTVKVNGKAVPSSGKLRFSGNDCAGKGNIIKVEATGYGKTVTVWVPIRGGRCKC